MPIHVYRKYKMVQHLRKTVINQETPDYTPKRTAKHVPQNTWT